MNHSFQPTPDARPYALRKPKVDLNAKNPQAAWGAGLSEKFDLTKEDRADDLLFNEVIWRSVKGADSPRPPPVRAAWFFPHPGGDKDTVRGSRLPSDRDQVGADPEQRRLGLDEAH